MKRQQKLGGQRGFTLKEMLVLVVAIVVLAMILLPALAKRYARSSRANCQNNLKQIVLAFRTWEGDYNDLYPAHVPKAEGGVQEMAVDAFRSFQVMSNELNNPKIISCPNDDRLPAIDFDHLSNSNVSYFIGLDADDTAPAMPVSGDRNLIANGKAAVPGLAVIRTNDVLRWSTGLHNGAGNIGLADGSVQHVSGAGLQQLFQKSGTNVNRLAIP